MAQPFSSEVGGWGWVAPEVSPRLQMLCVFSDFHINLYRSQEFSHEALARLCEGHLGQSGSLSLGLREQQHCSRCHS